MQPALIRTAEGGRARARAGWGVRIIEQLTRSSSTNLCVDGVELREYDPVDLMKLAHRRIVGQRLERKTHPSRAGVGYTDSRVEAHQYSAAAQQDRIHTIVAYVEGGCLAGGAAFKPVRTHRRDY